MSRLQETQGAGDATVQGDAALLARVPGEVGAANATKSGFAAASASVATTCEGVTPQPEPRLFVPVDVLSDELYVPIRKCPVPWRRRLKRISTS